MAIMTQENLLKYDPDTLVNEGVDTPNMAFLEEFAINAPGLSLLDWQALDDGKSFKQQSTGMTSSYTTRGGTITDAGSPTTEWKTVDNAEISNSFTVPTKDIRRHADIVGEYAVTLARDMANNIITDLYSGTGSNELNSFRSLTADSQVVSSDTYIDPTSDSFIEYIDDAIQKTVGADAILMPSKTFTKFKTLLRNNFVGNDWRMIEGYYAYLYEGMPVIPVNFNTPWEDVAGNGSDLTATDGTTYKYQSVYVFRRSLRPEDEKGICYTHPTMDTLGAWSIDWGLNGNNRDSDGNLKALKEYIMSVNMNLFLKDDRSLTRILGVDATATAS